MCWGRSQRKERSQLPVATTTRRIQLKINRQTTYKMNRFKKGRQRSPLPLRTDPDANPFRLTDSYRNGDIDRGEQGFLSRVSLTLAAGIAWLERLASQSRPTKSTPPLPQGKAALLPA